MENFQAIGYQALQGFLRRLGFQSPRRGSILNGHGDETVVQWGNSPREIEFARETFKRYKEAKPPFEIFERDEDGERGPRMTEFDEDAHGFIAVPRMVGG